MKKILIPIIVLLLGAFVGMVIYSNNKNTDIEFYTIPENYSFVQDEDSRLEFYVYSVSDKPLISYPENNSYQLKLDDQSYNLNNVKCETIPSEDYYIVDITADMPNITTTEYISETCKLVIVNGLYTLNLDLGSLSVIDSSYYKLISLDSLSGTYSYVNGVMNLVGINLTLTKSYKYLTQLRVGGFAYGCLSKSKFNMELASEVNIENVLINYKYNQVEERYTLGISSKTIFIPIGYLKFSLTKSGYMVLELDGEKYYFDAFPYMATNPKYSKYESIGIKGEIVNA